MTHRILLLAPLPPVLQEKLAEVGPVDLLPAPPERREFLDRNGPVYTVGVTHGTAVVDDAMLSGLPNLRAICSLGAGYDLIDVGAARQRGIVVSNTPDIVNDCVADLAMGLVIDVARRVSGGDRYVRAGEWETKGMAPLGFRVSGKRLGILGMGRIGRVIARRAAAFDMAVRYHARTRKEDVALEYEESVGALARWSDFLVVAASGGASTANLVSADVLQALGPTGYLINVARGSIVDEAALINALKEQRIAGAALDVFFDEPRVPAELRAMDNVVLTPHIGTATRETRGAMAKLVVDNVRSFVESGVLLTPVED